MESKRRPIILLIGFLLGMSVAYGQGDDPIEVVVVNIGQSQTINCISDPVEIGVRVFPEHQDYIYTWNTGETTATIMVKPNSTTIFTVEVSNAALDFHTTRAFVVTVSNVPVEAIEDHHTVASNVCPGTALVLSADYTGGYPPYTFQWGNGGQDKNITVYPTATENHFVTITDACGSSDVAMIEIVLEPQNELVAPSDKPILFPCKGTELAISPNSIGELTGGVGYGYKYTFSDWSNAGKSALIKTEEDATIEVFMTDACGIQSASSKFILRHAAPQVPDIEPLTVCSGREINVCANEDDLRLYYWDGETMNMNHSIIAEPGNEIISLKFIDECGQTQIINRTISGVEISSEFNFDVHASTEVVELRVDNPRPDHQYTWSRDGVEIGTGEFATDRFNKGSSSTFELTVNDENGCSSVTAQKVFMEDNFSIPSAFSPNGDGQNDVFEIFFDDTFIDFDIKIFDRWGQLVYHSSDQYFRWNAEEQLHQDLNTFVYRIEASTLDGNKINKVGTLTIVN